MPIVRQGSLNTTALVVPDLYVQIVPPQVRLLNGVPTDILAVVGTAAWGPVNRPTTVASYSDFARAFGPLRDRRHDAGTCVAVGVQQGASNFLVVRVTDGTDTKAQAAGPASTGAAFYARHTGSFGNSIRVQISAGARPGTWRAVVGAPGVAPEAFDGLPGTGFWPALEAAINYGTDIRGPSALVTFSKGTASAAPTATTYALSGGTDGADGVDATDLIGSDGAVRTGVHTLRGSGASILVVADFDTVIDWPALEAFTASEGIYGVVAFPAGTSIPDAVDQKGDVGVFDWTMKVMHGDHLIWRDPTSGRLRTVSPAPFAAARLANLSPEQSSLNKQIFGVIGSQRTGLPGSDEALAYSHAELSQLFLAGIDVICNPVPGGRYWGCRAGHNASPDVNVQGDNYTRMTGYVTRTLDAAMGQFVGALLSDTLMTQVTATVTSFLAGMEQQGMLRPLAGQPSFSVVCDKSNNPPARLAAGYLQCDVQVRYAPINERFILNVEAGQGVTITRVAA